MFGFVGSHLLHSHNPPPSSQRHRPCPGPPGNIKKGKGMFYIAQYSVRRTAQSVLHFLPSLTDLFIPTPTRLLREAF